jgi:hypothetical protein
MAKGIQNHVIKPRKFAAASSDVERSIVNCDKQTAKPNVAASASHVRKVSFN